METLAFYSYTGGVRRSILLVDAARHLALALDKRVVAVDLDFDAPGLHYRFSEGFRGELPIRGGTVPYLVATAQGAASPLWTSTWSRFGSRLTPPVGSG